MPAYYSYYNVYVELNNWVYHNLFENLLPNTNVIMAFHSQLHNVCDIDKQDFDIADAGYYLARCDWSKLCYETGGIPQYLGLIALQVYVAVNRNDNDYDFTAEAYNPFLQEYLDDIDSNKLQSLYRNGQHEIYGAFERWGKRRGLSICLAKEIKSGKGCYVQYPLSLSILRKKDFDSMCFVFHQCGFGIHGDLDYNTFKKRLQGGQKFWPSNIRRIWSQLGAESDYDKAFWAQMYTAYLEWDGYYVTPKGKKQQTTNKTERHIYSIYWDLTKKDSPPVFYKNDSKDNHIPFSEVFYLQDSVHKNDWQYVPNKQISRCLGDDNISDAPRQYIFICLLNSTKSFVSQEIELRANFIKEYKSYKLFLLTTNDISRLIQMYPQRFPQEPFVKLDGGIKLGRFIWMYGAGPRVFCKAMQTSEVVLWGKASPQKIDLSKNELTNLEPGSYFIQYSAIHPSILFEVQEITPCYQETRCGWEIGEEGFKPSNEKYDVHGLDFSRCSTFIKESIFSYSRNVVRDWLNQEICNEKECKSTSTINKAIRRAENGICNRKS